MLAVYTAAIFLSATLLFLVQPMVGKLVLPALGGTPAVWNTCMVFFQVLLLIGYTYAHLVTRYLGARSQTLLHGAAALAPLALLPIALPKDLSVPAGEFPIPWLLGVLAAMAGVPFLLLSTNGPLLQRWFSSTDHPRASNPYFLYAASNVGSLIALLGYPIVIEPWLTLKEQARWWGVGYVVLVVLLVACAIFRVRRAGAASGSVAAAPEAAATSDVPTTWRTRALWVLLAFAPSSLMIGSTTFISTDVAPAPLLWVIPLSIYLVTMIVAFSHYVKGATRAATALLPIVILALTVSMLMEARKPIGVLVTLHLVTMAAAAMACHGRLSMMRPDPRRLTEYYLLISLGGALGGLFNGIVAPLLFNRILEYPIALAVSLGLAMVLGSRDLGAGGSILVPEWLKLLLHPRPPEPAPIEGRGGRPAPSARPASIPVRAGGPREPDSTRKPAPAWIVPIGFGSLLFVTSLFITLRSDDVSQKMLVIKLYVPAAASIAMIIAGWRHDESSRWRRRTLNVAAPIAIASLYVCLEFANAALEIAGTRKGNALSFGLPALACFLLVRWPWRFTGGVTALLTLSAFSPGLAGFPLLTERTFFGVHRVIITAHGTAFELLHGNTQHGAQLRVPGQEHLPTTYYHPTGPAGDAFRLLNEEGRIKNVALVGLGVGTLAAYCEPGQTFTFYEIDPSIVRVARDSGYFTFIRDAQGTVDFKVGDGRLLLDRAEGAEYDMIVLDAFSSDAIPMHLLTVEAIEVYFKRLSEHGVLLVHTSNRHLSLVRVLAGNARRLGLAIRMKADQMTASDSAIWKNSSEWVVMARRPEDIKVFDKAATWWPVDPPPGVAKVWTDDFSDVLGVMENMWGRD